MLISHDREKLINAIIFFVQNTEKCGKIKLFKLLYFLDFEHFKATGRSVTGLDYYAWPKGPVPRALHEEIDNPKPDMAQSIRFGQRAIRQGKQSMLSVDPLVPFAERNFSKREMRLLRDLAEEYRESDAEEMVEVTHLENKPWDRIYVQKGLKQALIPYELAVRPDEVREVMRVAEDRKQLLEKLG